MIVSQNLLPIMNLYDMKKFNIIILFILVLIMISCHFSKKSKLEHELKKIYNKQIKKQKTSEGLVYELNYSNNISDVKRDTRLITNFTDRILNSNQTEKYLDTPGDNYSTLNDIYYWDTPEIRVFLKATRSLSSDNKIYYVVTEK